MVAGSFLLETGSRVFCDSCCYKGLHCLSDKFNHGDDNSVAKLLIGLGIGNSNTEFPLFIFKAHKPRAFNGRYPPVHGCLNTVSTGCFGLFDQHFCCCLEQLALGSRARFHLFMKAVAQSFSTG
jgi:hypothetical protein